LNMSAMSTTMPAGCWDLDLETGELKLCPHSRTLFGLNADPAEPLSERDWAQRLHPDDLAAVWAAMRACISHERPYAERFRTIHADGTMQPVFGIGRPIKDDDGGRVRFVGWNFDAIAAGALAGNWISEHPEALIGENLLSINSSPKATEALLERARFILRVRRSRERLLGRAMIGEPAFDLLLSLYVQQGQQENSLTSLAQTAGIPYSSAMRWVSYLGDKDLIERSHSDENRRSLPVRLTQTGRAVMDELLSIR
jgi:DNA-binding MarR family transcriptional regulator